MADVAPDGAGEIVASQSINITPRRGWDFRTCAYFSDEGGSMPKKRLLAFSLMIGLSALFITPLIDSGITASAQDAKVKQDGFISGCSVIDPLDECIQARFKEADKLFGYARVTPRTHVQMFSPKNEEESIAVSELEREGWQVSFYLAGRRIVDSKPESSQQEPGNKYNQHPVINGPLPITKNVAREDLPNANELRDHAKKALLAFDTRNQYEFSVQKWSFTGRPIRADEMCLRCHNPNPPPVAGTVMHLPYAPAPGNRPVNIGDALGVAIYAYARKQ